MKCKTCNGLGRTKATEFIGVDEGLRDVVILCPTCGGKGEIEQTEQEYIQTCNTEQLAEFLSKIEEQYPCGSLLKCDVTCGYHSQCRGDDVAPTNKEVWVEWLKQPHTEKE